MNNTLDTLAAKADALEAMYNRKDPNYAWAREVFEAERLAWYQNLSAYVLGMIDRMPS